MRVKSGTMTVWLLSPGVPVLGILLAAVFALTLRNLNQTQRGVGVIFVDIIGVTSHPAVEVIELLNRFFAVMVVEVDRQRGPVNKFEGDAALAVFGAPNDLDRPEDGALPV